MAQKYAADAKTAGADAYILKREMSAKLMPVLRDLLSHDLDGLKSISERRSVGARPIQTRSSDFL